MSNRHLCLQGFGTNYPMITADRALADLDALELDETARELYLHGHAERIFALGDNGKG